MHQDAILAVDIGGGTQDIVIWSPEERIENCVKLILPSPTRIVAGRIRQATNTGKPVFFDGVVMGGGANTRALRDHLAAGLKAYATPEAAQTFHDNPDYVRKMGVEILDDPPQGADLIHLRDVDIEPLSRLLAAYGVAVPSRLAVAVQDHGFSPVISNRETRFNQWKTFLSNGGGLQELVYTSPPPMNTRMGAVRKSGPLVVIMDTGPAAILGALLDEWAHARRANGILVVNVGNEHTLAALVHGERVFGVYEHHTSCLDEEKARDHLDRFRQGVLEFKEVYDDQGHGVAYADSMERSFDDVPTVVTGPQRALLRTHDMHMAAPFGDMMLSGCFGLIQGALGAWNMKYSLHSM